MNVVGTYKDTGKVYESLSYEMEEEKEVKVNAIISDSQKANIQINIQYMSDNELIQLNAQ